MQEHRKLIIVPVRHSQPHSSARRHLTLSIMHTAIVLLIACLVASSVHAIPSTKSRLRSSAPTATARSLVRGDNHDHHQYSNNHINNNNNNHGPLQQRSSTAVQVVANGAAAGEEATIIWTALNSITTLLLTCGLDVYFSKVGLVDDNTMAVLSKLIFNIFQPAFLFSNVLKIVATVFAQLSTNCKCKKPSARRQPRSDKQQNLGPLLLCFYYVKVLLYTMYTRILYTQYLVLCLYSSCFEDADEPEADRGHSQHVNKQQNLGQSAASVFLSL